jgi:hypothetical protein
MERCPDTATPGWSCTVIQPVSVGLALNLPVDTSFARADCDLTMDSASATVGWLSAVGLGVAAGRVGVRSAVHCRLHHRRTQDLIYVPVARLSVSRQVLVPLASSPVPTNRPPESVQEQCAATAPYHTDLMRPSKISGGLFRRGVPGL